MAKCEITLCDVCSHNPSPAVFRVAIERADPEAPPDAIRRGGISRRDVCLYHYGIHAAEAQTDPRVMRFAAERIGAPKRLREVA